MSSYDSWLQQRLAALSSHVLRGFSRLFKAKRLLFSFVLRQMALPPSLLRVYYA